MYTCKLNIYKYYVTVKYYSVYATVILSYTVLLLIIIIYNTVFYEKYSI